jgi:hypothetical protein
MQCSEGWRAMYDKQSAIVLTIKGQRFPSLEESLLVEKGKEISSHLPKTNEQPATRGIPEPKHTSISASECA